MEYNDDSAEAAELEEALYSRIHHDRPDAHEILSEAHHENIQLKKAPIIQHNRSVTKHSIVNNSKMNKKMSKNRKKASEKFNPKCNLNPFAIATAMSNQIQIPTRLTPYKTFTPYTSYLSEVDSRPIDPSPAPLISTKVEENVNDQRPNPFNCGFNRAEEKMKRLQLMQAKRAQADQIRQKIQHLNNVANDNEIDEGINNIDDHPKLPNIAAIGLPAPNITTIHVPDSDSEDEVYIYPPELPTVISSDDDDDNSNVNEENKASETIDNLQDDCDEINVDYETRLSRHDDPFGGIDVAELNSIVLENPSINVQPVNDSADNFAKPQRANRHSLKRSYEVSETDFPATDVYESESSDLPECNARDNGKKMTTILSESEGSDIDTTNLNTKRSKRMRKRKSSGSNRGSDCFSSDDSDADDHNCVEHEKSNRTYLFRGEGVYNAITKFPKRTIDTQRKPDGDIDAEADYSSDDSPHNDQECEKDNFEENWTVTDQVGETDNIDLDLSTLASLADDSLNNEEIIESNVDKDDDNSVRSKRLVIHPEMGWNKEMKAFYNDSWGGETHNARAIRREMPRSILDWPIDPSDLKDKFNALKVKCHNCRENGHRQAQCPQPKKEVVCYTCGEGGHREARCPHAMCLKCGEKTNTYRRSCERCFRLSHVTCKKCHRRGHLARDCPDNWRAYHNTTDPDSTPVRLPSSGNIPRKYCSACAAQGHRADQCYNFRMYFQDDVIPSDIRQYRKVYVDEAPIDNSMSTPYSMFENPRENFVFKWNVNESSDRVYGRFLAATKVERDKVVKRKQKKIPCLMDITVEDPFEKLVLNPMNAQNMREKPKKQFSKNFYEESTAARAQIRTEETSNEITTNDKGNENDGTCFETNAIENVDPCNDVEMEDLEGSKSISNDTSKDCDNSNIDPLDAYKLTEDAFEADQLQETNMFSFSKEIEELEKSKSLFDLSFIGSISGDNQEVDNNSTITKSKERKIRNEAEIERLTEMEISLQKLKKELSKKKQAKNDDIVLNTTNSANNSVHCVHDSDSNYSFGEYFNESTRQKDKVDESVENEPKGVVHEPDSALSELPDYIPLPQDIDALDTLEESCTLDDPPEKPVSEAKIFLTKEHARMLLSTEAGNTMLNNASSTYNVKVRMDFENLGNVLVVTGSKLNQNKFHADLIRFLVEVCKKMRLRNETFQQIPRSKVALIRFIRENFALLDQPLGNPTELYKNMRRNEKLQSKNGIKNADRARKNLNIILMGRAGLLDGRLHLDALESNLRFLLENNKDMITKQTREEIYQHYRYVFSPFEHDDYPDLISKYEELKKSKKFPPLNIDKSLLELKITVNDDQSVELNRAKQKLMQVSNTIESPKSNKEPTGQQETSAIHQEPKTPKRELKPQRREPKTPRSLNSPKLQSKNVESTDVYVTSTVEDPSNVNKNAIWSLKCKDIVEKCRQKPIKSSKVVDKLNSVLEKASKNQLSHGDYQNLEKILNTLNRSVN